MLKHHTTIYRPTCEKVVKAMGGAFSSFFQRPSMPPENVPPVSIVVVGASFAGLAAVRTLVQASDPTKRRPFRVTVVEPKGYFEYTPGILRALVAPEHADALCVPLKEYVRKGNTGPYEMRSHSYDLRMDVHTDACTVVITDSWMAVGQERALGELVRACTHR